MAHQRDNNSDTITRDNIYWLQQIAENTRVKKSIILVVSGSDSTLVTTYEQPIKLDPTHRYELALLNLETYYSFPNIDSTNNRFRYRKDNKTAWTMVEIPVGCYEIRAINKEIIRQVKNNSIQVAPNNNTLKCILCIKDDYEVDFNIPNSIRTVLGFNPKIYKKGRYESENIVNILRTNSILVHTAIITGSYQDGRMEPVIYSFFPNVSPGEKITTIQQNLVYAPVTTDTIYRMTTWLTDQSNNKLDLQGEILTVRFHLREC